MGLNDQSILEQFETKEIAESILYRSVNGYNLYRSVEFAFRKDLNFGRPILCDFAFAHDGQVEHCHDIQSNAYRAPEVILEMRWGYAVDVWNVGVMVRDFPAYGKYHQI